MFLSNEILCAPLFSVLYSLFVILCSQKSLLHVSRKGFFYIAVPVYSSEIRENFNILDSFDIVEYLLPILDINCNRGIFRIVLNNCHIW